VNRGPDHEPVRRRNMKPTLLFGRFGLLGALSTVAAQSALTSQSANFNSSYTLTDAQIKKLGGNNDLVQAVETALNFERTNWAGSSVSEDDFYSLPSNASGAGPGSLLKVEMFTNTTLYTVPPGTALSRLVYITETSTGVPLPASAFILWPYSPRTNDDGKIPVVVWAHGNSGTTSECAPSHIRNLWYQYSSVFTLALAGYAVVAPDFAGLGINQTADGTPIRVENFVTRAISSDLIYAAQAAQSAFSELSADFVVMGHSIGAGGAWGVANRHHVQPIPGYLGAIAASPFQLESFRDPDTAITGPIETYASISLVEAIRNVHPDFNVSSFLTDTGMALYELQLELQSCVSVQQTLLLDQSPAPDALQPGWADVEEFRDLAKSTQFAGLEMAGPMLVLQATGDPLSNATIAAAQVNETCDTFPGSQIEYVEFNITGHIDILYASQSLWMDWIHDRFSHASAGNGTRGCSLEYRQPRGRPLEAYQQGGFKFFLEYATASYQTA
jgi:pimeloyl-ACP methyl ester carboxylesterase